jgi:Zn-dependent peptidase ImmA (M78 family)
VRWRDAHHEAMIVAAQAHDDLGVDAFARIDVFAAMARELKLIFRPLDGYAALYLPSIRSSRAGALVNDQHPLALQRYSGGHELGHHRFDHGAQIDTAVELRLSGQTLPAHEMLAEAFAAWFLMPPERADVIAEALGVERPTTPLDVYAMALRFGTSYSATCVHLPSLKRATTVDVRQWQRLALKTIKQALTPTAPPGGWANDVWALSMRDAAEPLVVRAGDRLLFDEAEIVELPAGATEGDVPAPDLLTPARTVVDLNPEIDAGPATITLTVDGDVISYELLIERPRHGLYVAPFVGASA